MTDDTIKDAFYFYVKKSRTYKNVSAQKNPQRLLEEGLKVASTYSPTLKNAVPSAQSGLTSLFGMGRGGP